MYNIDCKYNTYTNLSLITSLDSLTIFFYYQESSIIILIFLKFNYDARGEFDTYQNVKIIGNYVDKKPPSL